MFVSTCGFPLTMWLLQVWIYKPLHTPLLCGREAELKIGRFGGSEQPALCEVLKNTVRSIGILFAYHLYVSTINLDVKPITVVVSVSCVIPQIILYTSLRGISITHRSDKKHWHCMLGSWWFAFSPELQHLRNQVASIAKTLPSAYRPYVHICIVYVHSVCPI